MGSKHGTRKNTIWPNQPPSRELKESVATSKRPFKLPYYFIASQHTRRYPPNISTPTILDMTYTSSLDSPTWHQDSSSNEEIWGVTFEEALYHAPNSKISSILKEDSTLWGGWDSHIQYQRYHHQYHFKDMTTY